MRTDLAQGDVLIAGRGARGGRRDLSVIGQRPPRGEPRRRRGPRVVFVKISASRSRPFASPELRILRKPHRAASSDRSMVHENLRARARRKAYHALKLGLDVNRRAPTDAETRAFVDAVDQGSVARFGVVKLSKLRLDDPVPTPAWLARARGWTLRRGITLIQLAALRRRDDIVCQLVRAGACPFERGDDRDHDAVGGDRAPRRASPRPGRYRPGRARARRPRVPLPRAFAPGSLARRRRGGGAPPRGRRRRRRRRERIERPSVDSGCHLRVDSGCHLRVVLVPLRPSRARTSRVAAPRSPTPSPARDSSDVRRRVDVPDVRRRRGGRARRSAVPHPDPDVDANLDAPFLHANPGEPFLHKTPERFAALELADASRRRWLACAVETSRRKQKPEGDRRFRATGPRGCARANLGESRPKRVETLLAAAAEDDARRVFATVRAGVDVDASDEYGMTALATAAWRGNASAAAAALLRCGADPRRAARGGEGLDAARAARAAGRTRLAEMLEDEARARDGAEEAGRRGGRVADVGDAGSGSGADVGDAGSGSGADVGNAGSGSGADGNAGSGSGADGAAAPKTSPQSPRVRVLVDPSSNHPARARQFLRGRCRSRIDPSSVGTRGRGCGEGTRRGRRRRRRRSTERPSFRRGESNASGHVRRPRAFLRRGGVGEARDRRRGAGGRYARERRAPADARLAIRRAGGNHGAARRSEQTRAPARRRVDESRGGGEETRRRRRSNACGESRRRRRRRRRRRETETRRTETTETKAETKTDEHGEKAETRRRRTRREAETKTETNTETETTRKSSTKTTRKSARRLGRRTRSSCTW